MEGNVGALGILGGGAITAALGILWWILRRTDRALERSNTAIQQTNRSLSFAGTNLALVEALRTAIYLQGNSLDQWEDWGVEVRRNHHRMQQKLVERGQLDAIEELPTPPTHLDLNNVFRNIPNNPAPEPTPPTPDAGASFIDRLLRPPGGG